MKLRLVLIGFLVLAMSCKSNETTKKDAPEKQPNILFIAIDDLRPEFGAYGSEIAITPNLDKLALEGIRFQNFNVEPQCTPSRSAFMTGRHPIRSGTTKVVWGILYGMTQW